MSYTIGLIFPHQLSLANPVLKQTLDQIVLIEDPLFFGDYQYPLSFHKQKLVLHRASMQYFYNQIDTKKSYLEYDQVKSEEKWQQSLTKLQATTFHCMEVDDFALKKRLTTFADDKGITLKWHPSTLFINQIEETTTWIKNQKHLQQTSFYIWQRKKHQILLDNKNKPLGGNWTYDSKNRKKLPASVEIPDTELFTTIKNEQTAIDEAVKYVRQHFPKNPGSLERFNYPITHRQASQVLDSFIKTKMSQFGPYQDAISQRDQVLFHSLLSSSLNIGLLDPQKVIDTVLKEYQATNEESLTSVEGFIRQIIGWREFMRATYHTHGVKMRTSNFFSHTQKLSKKWWTADTGLPIVDQTIQKALDHCYGHHIERLMIISNLMLLCRVDPQDVYRWFMELFIDAYDWVMVGNVYEMGQFATGGIFVTKPYVSSANYLEKMSDFKLDDRTTKVWNALYWAFIADTKDLLKNNPRMSLMHRLLEKKAAEEIEEYRQTANEFIKSVTKS